MLRALIFDVDGTLADTESAHLAAFNHAFAEFGLDWCWDEALYTELLNIAGGRERIQHYWRTTQPPLREVDAMEMQVTVNRLHELKTAAWARTVRRTSRWNTCPRCGSFRSSTCGARPTAWKPRSPGPAR